MMNRQFSVDGPDRLWVSDVTEHATAEGKVYLAVVLDAWTRRVVGWSITDHIRAELVVDALQMAAWRRRPPAAQAICHSATAANTRRGPSAVAFGPPACSDPSVRSATPTTTPWPRASSPRCSASCSTSTAGRRAARWAMAVFEW